MAEKRYKTTTKRCRELLKGDADTAVVMRLQVEDLTARDLADLANADTGGAVLLGVMPQDADDGQVGRIVGCPVDEDRLEHIRRMCRGCVPTIHADVFIENLNKDAFIRLEVPSSPQRPHRVAESAASPDASQPAPEPAPLPPQPPDLTPFRERLGQLREAIRAQLAALDGRLDAAQQEFQEAADNAVGRVEQIGRTTFLVLEQNARLDRRLDTVESQLARLQKEVMALQAHTADEPAPQPPVRPSDAPLREHIRSVLAHRPDLPFDELLAWTHRLLRAMAEDELRRVIAEEQPDASPTTSGDTHSDVPPAHEQPSLYRNAASEDETG